MKISRIALAPVISLIVTACNHPIEIVGEGDVTSASGTRYCFLEDYKADKDNCTKNTVTGAYEETYYATPRDGWSFEKWEGCQSPASSACSFSVPAETVRKAWGTTAPPLKAVFASAGRRGYSSLQELQGIWVGQGELYQKENPSKICRWSVITRIEGSIAYTNYSLIADNGALSPRCADSPRTEANLSITEAGNLLWEVFYVSQGSQNISGDLREFSVRDDGGFDWINEFSQSAVTYVVTRSFSRP